MTDLQTLRDREETRECDLSGFNGLPPVTATAADWHRGNQGLYVLSDRASRGAEARRGPERR